MVRLVSINFFKRASNVSSTWLIETRLYHSCVNNIATNNLHKSFLKSYINGSRQNDQSDYFRTLSSSNLPKYRTANLPSLSPTMETGNIETWEKIEGDELKEGDTLVQIETDKAVMSWEAPYTGYLAKILYPSHSKNIKVGQPIAIIVKTKEDVSAFKDFSLSDLIGETPAQTQTSKTQPESAHSSVNKSINQDNIRENETKGTSRVIASPLAKNIASSLGVSLSSITGSGPGNRIIAQDVKSHNSKPMSFTKTIPADDNSFTDIPLSNIRLVISKRLQFSKQTIPHYYLSVDLDMDKCISLRKSFNERLNGSVKISLNDFVIKAASLALMKVPACNSAFMDDFIRMYHDADISIAVSSERGLITPIIHSAQKKGLIEISSEVKSLAEKVRTQKILPHEYQGGSFSISNLGMYGIESFSAVINPPQTCILAVGTVRKVLVPINETSTIVKNKMYVTMSCDHRAVDGSVGAEWLQSFKGYIEDPSSMIL